MVNILIFILQYRFYGEPVVKAAVENGCHHLDISGEPEVRLGLFNVSILHPEYFILNDYCPHFCKLEQVLLTVTPQCADFTMAGHIISTKSFLHIVHSRSVGSKDSAVMRALASDECGLGLIPPWCHIWVEVLVGSCPTFRVFLPS